MNLLKFFFGNKKLAKSVAHFSLPSGWTCPGAKDCLTKVCPLKATLKQFGKGYRCYSASQEAYLPSVRKARWHNFDLLKGKSHNQTVNLIEQSLPKVSVIRLHVAGDFFSQNYFDAWLEVAKNHPQILFYGYTKSLPFLLNRTNQMPLNFRLVASKGGKFDHLIKKGLNSAEVVFSEDEAKRKNLPIDHDDSHCQRNKKSFALLIHGHGDPGSLQAKIYQKHLTFVGNNA